MSATFSGFSEDDINKVKTGKPVNEVNITKLTKTTLKNDKKGILKSKTFKPTKNASNVAFDLPDNAKLSTQTVKEPVEIVTSTIDNATSENDFGATKNENVVTVDVSKVEKKVIDLDEFQARQKLMEEQNRKRKELLAKALADRTKQTEDEARRLKEIQSEFKKLDDILSNDVSILRHQIEIASADFTEAQKRYHKVEKDFLDAKLALHQKLERKEMLTEHLCAIIEKNEERKADKLSELMNKLSVNGENLESFNSTQSTLSLTENNNKTNIVSNTENGAIKEKDIDIPEVINNVQ